MQQLEFTGGGCDVGLLRTVIPYIPQAIALHKLQKQQEYLSYHDNLTGVLNRNSFVAYLDHVEPEELKTLGALSVDINGLKNFNKESEEIMEMKLSPELVKCFRSISIMVMYTE